MSDNQAGSNKDIVVRIVDQFDAFYRVNRINGGENDPRLKAVRQFLDRQKCLRQAGSEPLPKPAEWDEIQNLYFELAEKLERAASRT